MRLRPAEGDRGRCRGVDGIALELGPLGPGRPTRGCESDHAGNPHGGGEARGARRFGVNGAGRREGLRHRQSASLPAQDVERRVEQPRPVRLRRLPSQLSRLRAYPHGLAVPHGIQRQDVQRLSPSRGSRIGSAQARGHSVQARHLRARRLDGHSAPEGGGLARAGDSDLSIRSRRMGEGGRIQDAKRRYRADSVWTLGETRR